MIHELEHVRRGDWLSQYMARIVRALYWFHPLVWIAWRRLSLEAERACDDAVLRRSEATAYANQLVLLAERLASTATPPLLAMAACRDLSTRVRAVLDGAQARGRAGALPVATAIVAAALFIAAVAPLRAVRQVQAPSDGAQQPPLAFETASVKPNKSGDGGAVHTAGPSWRQSHGGEPAAASTDHIRLSDSELPARGRARLDRFRSLRHPRQARA